MPIFEVHYEQGKQIKIELIEAESAESAWKGFVLRTKGEEKEGKRGEDKQVVCVIRH